MRTSRRLTNLLPVISALIIISVSALAADPGQKYPSDSAVSDQKAGSILFYNFYTSNATAGTQENSRINITNTSSTSIAYVHLFFVAENCLVADGFLCLTPNQTASFLASDFDPGFKGYLIGVATHGGNGWPVSFNFLIGDAYIKMATGHTANLPAESFAAQFEGLMPVFDDSFPTAVINFNGEADGYNQVPATLAVSNLPSRLDGNETRIIINRVAGNLSIGASTLGTLFGLLYDDAENASSFTISGGCQKNFIISNNEPRTIPRFETLVPSGRSGWLKIYTFSATTAILGSYINFNANAGARSNAFNGGSNMHKLTLTRTTSLTVPVFPSHC